MSKKVAVVTGSNKGIGFAIVRALCKQFDGDVILTARNEELGKEAVGKLEKENLSPKFHKLDLLDKASIESIKSYLQSHYGGLDILVNNAGIAYKQNSTEVFGTQAEVSIKTNYYGTLDVCDGLFPLLRPHARVVNVSSMGGAWAIKHCSKETQMRFYNKTETMDQLSSILQEFIQAAKQGKLQEAGFPETAYGMSKVGVTIASMIQQKQFDKDPREDLVVNACCPGYVNTDMSSGKGPLTIDQGAETPVYLALLPPGVKEPRGMYVKDKAIQPWQM